MSPPMTFEPIDPSAACSLHVPEMFEQVKSDHSDNDCRQHHFYYREIREEELPYNHVVISNTSFLEKKTKHNPEEESQPDLGVFIVMKCDKHHPFSLIPDTIVQQHGCGNSSDKKTTCGDNTGERELDRSIYPMTTCAAPGPS